MLVLICDCTYCGYRFQMPIGASDSIISCPKCAFVINSEPQPRNQPLSWEMHQGYRGAATATPPAEHIRPPQRKRKGMTVEEANEKAMQLARELRAGFFALSERQQAKLIGCSWATWKKAPFYPHAQGKRPAGQRKKPPSPKAESLTAGREGVTGEGDKNEVLQKLIDEHEADKEPSPWKTARGKSIPEKGCERLQASCERSLCISQGNFLHFPIFARERAP